DRLVISERIVVVIVSNLYRPLGSVLMPTHAGFTAWLNCFAPFDKLSSAGSWSFTLLVHAHEQSRLAIGMRGRTSLPRSFLTGDRISGHEDRFDIGGQRF